MYGSAGADAIQTGRLFEGSSVQGAGPDRRRECVSEGRGARFPGGAGAIAPPGEEAEQASKGRLRWEAGHPGRPTGGQLGGPGQLVSGRAQSLLDDLLTHALGPEGLPNGPIAGQAPV